MSPFGRTSDVLGVKRNNALPAARTLELEENLRDEEEELRMLEREELLDAIRRRRGLRWGIPAMLIAAPYLLIASICTRLIDDGGPGVEHGEGCLQRNLRIGVTSPIGEGIGRHVEDAHDGSLPGQVEPVMTAAPEHVAGGNHRADRAS